MKLDVILTVFQNIKITFRPVTGKQTFSKFYYFEGIKWISDKTE